MTLTRSSVSGEALLDLLCEATIRHKPFEEVISGYDAGCRAGVSMTFIIDTHHAGGPRRPAINVITGAAIYLRGDEEKSGSHILKYISSQR